MDGLFVSQNLSASASQSEVDRVSKGQQLAVNAESASEEVFLKVLDRSMREVNELASTEQHDSLLDDEKEDQDQEEK